MHLNPIVDDLTYIVLHVLLHIPKYEYEVSSQQWRECCCCVLCNVALVYNLPLQLGLAPPTLCTTGIWHLASGVLTGRGRAKHWFASRSFRVGISATLSTICVVNSESPQPLNPGR